MSIFAVVRSLKLMQSCRMPKKGAIQNDMASLSNKYGIGYQ